MDRCTGFCAAFWRVGFALALALVGVGCAHGELRRAIEMGPFEGKSVENVQWHAGRVFPVGMSRAEVLKKLGMDSGEVPPAVMLLTLRPWPFEPWRVGGDEAEIHAASEDDRNWLAWWHRSWMDLVIELDAEGRVKSVKAKRSSISL